MDLHLDTYEVKARIVPTIVVLIPVFLLLCVCGMPEGFKLTNNILSGVVGIVALYLLAQLLAYFGRTLQVSLFQKWGGTPSTRVMRWSDKTISDDKKVDIAKTVCVRRTTPTTF